MSEPKSEIEAFALGLAIEFHVTYERLSAKFNYITRTDTRIFDPDSSNGKLMIAVCREIIECTIRPMLQDRDAKRTAAYAELVAALNARIAELEKPIDMLLWCPNCGHQHIDEAEPESDWENPPHKSHLCHKCKIVWRPADVATNGVEKISSLGCTTWSGVTAETRIDGLEKALKGRHDYSPASPAEQEFAWVDYCSRSGWEPNSHPSAKNAFVEGFCMGDMFSEGDETVGLLRKEIKDLIELLRECFPHTQFDGINEKLETDLSLRIAAAISKGEL